MKKLVGIVCILLVIFIEMFMHQKEEIQNVVTASEVTSIEQYISQIYMWKEVTDEALPVFEDINTAPEKWVWEAVKKNLNNYDEITYEQIQQKAKDLFGEKFTKNFPKEGNESFFYDQAQDLYQATNMELDSDNDAFLLNAIQKTKEGYTVEIVEYIEDYSEELNVETEAVDEPDIVEEAEFTIHIKNTQGEEVASVKNTEGKDKIIEQVKANIEKFSKKTIYLEQQEGEENGEIVKCVRSVSAPV